MLLLKRNETSFILKEGVHLPHSQFLLQEDTIFHQTLL